MKVKTKIALTAAAMVAIAAATAANAQAARDNIAEPFQPRAVPLPR